MFSLKCLSKISVLTRGYGRSLGLESVHVSVTPDRVRRGLHTGLRIKEEKRKSRSERKVCESVLERFNNQYTLELGEVWLSASTFGMNWNEMVSQAFSSPTSVPDLINALQNKRAGIPTEILQTLVDSLPRIVKAVRAAKTGTKSIFKEVLLNPHCWQYGVLLNRFSDHLDVTAVLKSLGYYSLLSQPDPPNTRPLKCLVHKDAARLPTQRHREGWLKQYYLMNAASLLPVLALDVKDGERVLDLCSAPGGKALAVLQTANPGLLHCNEVDKSRYAWLVKTLESYVPHALRDTLIVTNEDGRDIGLTKLEMFDKVLVDAPCSNDRSWLFSPGAQQGELRLRERAKLPQLQKELICSALSAVRPGGIVVYSTCTFSSAENQSVMEAVLSTVQGAELAELEEELIGSLSGHFKFAQLQPPLGCLVVPEQGRTWGPMYVCRLRRTS